MFARAVSFRLKPNSLAEFTQTIEKEILPIAQEAGWALFYMAEEVDATAMGPDSEATRRRAAKRIMARMKSGGFNSAEVVKVAAKSFLGLPYVTISAHARHIQESRFLTHDRQVLESAQVELATAVPIQD